MWHQILAVHRKIKEEGDDTPREFMKAQHHLSGD
jgi:hypothetical protein